MWQTPVEKDLGLQKRLALELQNLVWKGSLELLEVYMDFDMDWYMDYWHFGCHKRTLLQDWDPRPQGLGIDR